MSAGRELCKLLIDAAADLRRYGRAVDEHAAADIERIVVGEVIILARRLEELVPVILDFEGEQRPALEQRNAREQL